MAIKVEYTGGLRSKSHVRVDAGFGYGMSLPVQTFKKRELEELIFELINALESWDKDDLCQAEFEEFAGVDCAPPPPSCEVEPDECCELEAKPTYARRFRRLMGMRDDNAYHG